MIKIHVAASRQYDVILNKGILSMTGMYVKDALGLQDDPITGKLKNKKICIVTDETVDPLYGRENQTLWRSLTLTGFEVHKYVFPGGEDSKNMETIEELLEFLAAKRFTRTDVLLALGGGDAGTGKSSTIKAVAAALAPQGLRLIEVKKNQLYQIPQIMEELASNPLKFILFIDDLSFNGNDDNFSALKATLEGSISGCGDNVAIYATSNRRHLVKETFSDRTGDELHVNDTLQETMSLSARFGLTITFQKPDKDQYLTIVRSLAAEYGIEMDEGELFRKAEAYAIRKSGRSPRTAKQFIELLKIGI